MTEKQKDLLREEVRKVRAGGRCSDCDTFAGAIEAALKEVERLESLEAELDSAAFLASIPPETPRFAGRSARLVLWTSSTRWECPTCTKARGVEGKNDERSV